MQRGEEMESAAAGFRLPDSASGVSIVIPHFGDPGVAERLVQTLQRSASDREIQIIVSDDGSPIPFPALRGFDLVRSESNDGFGAAVNRGASQAKHPWLPILNSDLIVEPDFIETLLSEAAPFQPALCWGRTVRTQARFLAADGNALPHGTFDGAHSVICSAVVDRVEDTGRNFAT